MSSMLEWAKWWQALGCAIYPLPPLRKKPAEKGLGIRSATTDLAQIEAWWSAQPDANIAVVGNPAATDRFLLRVDVDPKRSGDAAWNALVAQYGCPETLTIRTPSGGFHLYFTSPRAYGNSTGQLPPGIDIRGHLSGYTVGAGSVTTDVPGESVAGAYTLVAAVGIAPAPQWLLGMIETARHEGEPVEALTVVDDVTFVELRDALMSPGMLQDWDRWSDNGLALRSLGDRGYQLWTEYSARQLEVCADHPRGTDTSDTWWRRHRATGIKSDYRSIFTRAQALGWRNPRSVDPSTLGFGQAQLPMAATAAPLPGVQDSGPRFRLLSETEFTSAPDPQWRVDGLLPEQGLALIFGNSGAGKSFFTLDLLAHIADGRDYGVTQRKVNRGRTVYVMAEGAAGMRKRVRAYRHKYPSSGDNFKIIAAAPNLMTPADVGEIAQVLMQNGGADVIVFDTMHACMAGADENSAKDIGTLLGNARALSACLNACVIFVHHTGKDEARGARGSSSIRAGMEAQIEITRNPTDPNRRVARIEKLRDGGEEGYAWEYVLEPVIVLDGPNPCASAVVKHIERSSGAGNAPKRHKKSETQDVAVMTLREMSDQYSDGIPLEVLIVGVNARRSDLRPDNIRRSITRAIDRGELSIDSDSVVRLAWL